VALDALGEGRVTEIVEAMIERAVQGDVSAASLILSRAWPPRKGRPTPIKLPMGAGAGATDLAAAAGAVVAAVADGTLTPEEAESVARVLETQRRSIEALDIERRLSALEAKGA
jgi:hypothetical protein